LDESDSSLYDFLDGELGEKIGEYCMHDEDNPIRKWDRKAEKYTDPPCKETEEQKAKRMEIEAEVKKLTALMDVEGRVKTIIINRQRCYWDTEYNTLWTIDNDDERFPNAVGDWLGYYQPKNKEEPIRYTDHPYNYDENVRISEERRGRDMIEARYDMEAIIQEENDRLNPLRAAARAIKEAANQAALDRAVKEERVAQNIAVMAEKIKEKSSKKKKEKEEEEDKLVRKIIDGEEYLWDKKTNALWEMEEDEGLGRWVGYYQPKNYKDPIRFTDGPDKETTESKKPDKETTESKKPDIKVVEGDEEGVAGEAGVATILIDGDK
jgi:hypothetical protein